MQTFQAVLERRPTALGNHNYLRKTAWDMAHSLVSQAETQRERERLGMGDRTITVRGDVGATSRSPLQGTVNEDADDPPATEEDRRRVLDMLRAFTGKFGS